VYVVVTPPSTCDTTNVFIPDDNGIGASTPDDNTTGADALPAPTATVALAEPEANTAFTLIESSAAFAIPVNKYGVADAVNDTLPPVALPSTNVNDVRAAA